MRAAGSIDWQALPWRQPERWPRVWQRALPVLSFALSLLLVAAGLWLPSVQELQAQRRETRSLREQTVATIQRSEILKQQQQRRQDLQHRHAQAMQALGDDDALSLLQALREQAEQAGLREEHYEPQPATQLDCCEVQSSRWVLRGDYGALREWLDALSQQQPLLRADQLQWQSAEDAETLDGAPLQLQLVVHHYRRPEPRP